MISAFFKPLASSSTVAKKQSSATKKPSSATKKRKATGPSAAELKRAKKIVAAGKKAKKEKDFRIGDELLSWAKAGTLYSEINGRTTSQLKGVCQDSGLRYGGAKYKLVERLLEHGKEGLRRHTWAAKKEAAEAGDASAEAEALFFAGGPTFGRALQLFRREHKKLMEKTKKNKKTKKPFVMDHRKRFQWMAGMTAGFDAALTKAITGKDRKKYNGSRGEKGIEGQYVVAELWTSLLIDALTLGVEEEGAASKVLSCEDWQVACEAAWEARTSGDYGFPSYGSLITTPELEAAIMAAGPEIVKVWSDHM
jgi:hypothetical protein